MGGGGRISTVLSGFVMAGLLAATAGAQVPSLPGSPLPTPRIPFTLTTNGATPDIAVDEEGAAHVVWNEVAPTGSADVLHYCKVPRGSRRCTVEHAFVPPDGEPHFNRESGRPRVAVPSPDEVVVFTFRYPNVVNVDDQGGLGTCTETSNDPSERCYSSSRKTYVYRSFDGGASFGGARVFSHTAPSGDLVVLHPPGAAPQIATVTETTTGGTFFAAAPTDGYARREINLGDEGPDQAYDGTLGVLQDDKLAAAYTDLSHNVYLRPHFDPATSLMDRDAWGPSLAISGDEPRLAGGPGGLYLLYKPRVGTTDRPYTLRRIAATGVLGPAIPLSESGRDINHDLFEDESGRVHAAWVSNAASRAELRYRFAPDGESFSAPLKLGREPTGQINHTGLGAAEDGGGFAVYATGFLSPGAIRLVPFGTAARRRLIDVSIAAIEVTQGIQNDALATRDADPAKPAVFDYPGIKLAALHSTVVRIYANSRRAIAGATVPSLVIRAYKDGRPLSGGALLPDTIPTALPVRPPSVVADAERLSTTTVYTYTLPWQWAQGNVELRAEINPVGLLPAVAECRLCRRDNAFTLRGLVFNPTARIRFQPVGITVNGANPRGFPDPQPLFRAARETSPLPFDLPDYRGAIDMSDLANATQVKEESCFIGVWPCESDVRPITQSERLGFALDRLADWAADKSSSTFPIGAFRRGSTLGGVTRGGTQLFGGRQPLALVGDDRPLTSVAHEIGHGLGRVHADTGSNCGPYTVPGTERTMTSCPGPHPDGSADCGGNTNGQVGEAWPPNNDGALDGMGLDLTRPSPYAVLDPAVPGAPAAYLDFMSYCANTNETTSGGNVPDAWVSIRNWERNLAVGSPSSRRRTARGGGRFVARVAAARGAAARTLRAVALVPLGGKPTIIGVAPDDGAPTPVEASSTYRLVTRDSTGAELATAGAVTEAEHIEGELPIVVVTGRVPAAGAASVDLVAGGEAVAQQVASTSAPKVRITAPRRGATVGRGGSVDIRWRATDADGDPLEAIVEYSTDGGKRFTTLSIGPNKNRVSLRSALLSASGRAHVRVRVQDGFHETVATSSRFTALGAPPSVRISAPAPGIAIAAGAALSLRGEAFDDTGRALNRKRSLQWRIGRRLVGRGGLVSVAGLAAGTHTIVLRARDRRGRVGTASTRVAVEPRPPQFTVLKAPRAVRRKARRVVLRVAAAFDSRLSVGRTRARVGRRPRKVAVRIAPGRGLLVLDLTLASGKLRSTQRLEIPRR